MAEGRLIAKGKVVFDKPNYYLLYHTSFDGVGLMGKRYVRLGLWAQDYIGKTLIILEDITNEER